MSTYSKIIAFTSFFNILFCTFELGRISAGGQMSLLSTLIIAVISIASMVDAFSTPSK